MRLRLGGLILKLVRNRGDSPRQPRARLQTSVRPRSSQTVSLSIAAPVDVGFGPNESGTRSPTAAPSLQHERLRLRCILDAIVDAVVWPFARRPALDPPRLRPPERPASRTKISAESSTPKGFWRIDKEQDPELAPHRSDPRSPSTPWSDLIGTRTPAIVTQRSAPSPSSTTGRAGCCPRPSSWPNAASATMRAPVQPQPVASRLGPRFLDWQLAQTPEESWAECKRHARELLGDEEYDRRFPQPANSTPSEPSESRASVFSFLKPGFESAHGPVPRRETTGSIELPLTRLNSPPLPRSSRFSPPRRPRRPRPPGRPRPPPCPRNHS
jgi:hypothetical protein